MRKPAVQNSTTVVSVCCAGGRQAEWLSGRTAQLRRRWGWWGQGVHQDVIELMLEGLRQEVAGQEDHEKAMLEDPLRWELPLQQMRTHTPPRLPLVLTQSLRQAAARLFTVPPPLLLPRKHLCLVPPPSLYHHHPCTTNCAVSARSTQISAGALPLST